MPRAPRSKLGPQSSGTWESAGERRHTHTQSSVTQWGQWRDTVKHTVSRASKVRAGGGSGAKGQIRDQGQQGLLKAFRRTGTEDVCFRNGPTRGGSRHRRRAGRDGGEAGNPFKCRLGVSGPASPRATRNTALPLGRVRPRSNETAGLESLSFSQLSVSSFGDPGGSRDGLWQHVAVVTRTRGFFSSRRLADRAELRSRFPLPHRRLRSDFPCYSYF